MRRTFAILALTLFCSSLTSHFAVAGGHGHSGNGNHPPQNQHSKPQPLAGNKGVTGNKNGLGYIADPARRNLAPKGNPGNVTAIMDPLKLNNPTRVAPVVRDHSVLNPNPIVSPPRSRYDAIQGGGLGLDLNPFDFQAPMNFDNQVRDHRTTTSGFPGGGYQDPKKGHNGWTSNTTGPANRSPVKP